MTSSASFWLRYRFCTFSLRNSTPTLSTGPSPGFSSRGAKNQKEGPETRRAGHIKKDSIGCMQKWGSKREMGGHPISNGEPGTTAPPLATALSINKIRPSVSNGFCSFH